jgi:hypothetical protein
MGASLARGAAIRPDLGAFAVVGDFDVNGDFGAGPVASTGAWDFFISSFGP